MMGHGAKGRIYVITHVEQSGTWYWSRILFHKKGSVKVPNSKTLIFILAEMLAALSGGFCWRMECPSSRWCSFMDWSAPCIKQKFEEDKNCSSLLGCYFSAETRLCRRNRKVVLWCTIKSAAANDLAGWMIAVVLTLTHQGFMAKSRYRPDEPGRGESFTAQEARYH